VFTEHGKTRIKADAPGGNQFNSCPNPGWKEIAGEVDAIVTDIVDRAARRPMR